MEENQGFKPDPGNLAVRHYRGATGIVSHGGNVNPSCNRKSRNGNPPPKASAPVLYPEGVALILDIDLKLLEQPS